MSEMSNQNRLTKTARELLVLDYIDALDTGNLAQGDAIMAQAFEDAELLQLIESVEAELAKEAGILPQAEKVAQIRALIQQYLVSTFEQEQAALANSLKPLTIGEVAARLEARNKLPPALQAINEQLLRNTTPLPNELSLSAIKALAQQIGAATSDFYWRQFKEAAIALGVARSHDQMQLAAREQKPRRPNRKEEL